jgi:Tat protein secretion system quality control protein TatD with DNase activity
MLFDTHVNLHAEQFAGEVDDVIARARAAGVTRFVTICDRLDRYPAVRQSLKRTRTSGAASACIPTMRRTSGRSRRRALVREASDPKVGAIGETGLDQHYGYSDIALQERSFVEHIHAARETGPAAGRPHARSRRSDGRHSGARVCKRGPFRILMHCYTAGERLARRAMDMGAQLFSFRNPVVQRRNRRSRRDWPKFRSIGSFSRPIARISRRSRIGAAATSPRIWSTCASAYAAHRGLELRGGRAPDDRQRAQVCSAG